MSEKVLYMILMGGLGNQMFQVAMALAMCRRFGYKLVLSDNEQSQYGTARPIGWNSVLKPLIGFRGPIPSPLQGFIKEEVIEDNWDAIYNGKLAIADRVGFQGYFQCSKYYVDVADELKAVFDYMIPERKEALAKKYFSPEKKRRVAVHFRFVELWPDSRIWWDKCVPTLFYKKVMEEYIQKDAEVLVFVDGQYDPTLIFKELGFNENTVKFVNEEDYEEMWMMGQCHDVICPQSTFSWWGAYLGDCVERVIVPTADWVKEDVSGFFKLSQPNWVLVEP